MASASSNTNQAAPIPSHSSDASTTCLNSAYKALKRRLRQILQKNDSLVKKQKSLQQQLEQALQSDIQLRCELKHLHETYHKLARDTNRISMEKAQVFEQLEYEKFQRQLGDLILSQYQDEIKERKEDVEREMFKKQLSDLLLDQYRDEIEEQVRTLSQKDNYIKTCKASLAEAHSEISTVNSQMLYLKQRVVVGEEHICDLTRKLEGCNEQITRQDTSIAQHEKERREAIEERRYFEAQITRLKNTYDELARRVEAMDIEGNSDE
ncbi:hypothetical protein SNK03_013380 [Fusarium graminearum]